MLATYMSLLFASIISTFNRPVRSLRNLSVSSAPTEPPIMTLRVSCAPWHTLSKQVLAHLAYSACVGEVKHAIDVNGLVVATHLGMCLGCLSSMICIQAPFARGFSVKALTCQLQETSPRVNFLCSRTSSSSSAASIIIARSSHQSPLHIIQHP